MVEHTRSAWNPTSGMDSPLRNAADIMLPSSGIARSTLAPE